MSDTLSISERATAAMGGGLVRYDAACRALAEARSVDEVKDFRNKAEAMRAYARQAKNREMEADAAEIRFRAERRLGELMAMQRDTVGLAPAGRPKEIGLQENPIIRPPTLAEAGIDKNLADRARKFAAIPETQFEGMVGEWRDRIEAENERVTTNLLNAGEKHVRGTFGTGENEWYTPDEFLVAARDVLGKIDIDPASSEAAQAKVRASRYFTAADDGLTQEWHGRVWLNPPYAQPFIAQFVGKLIEEIGAGRTTAAIMLTHNYTDTDWFQRAAHGADAICFTRGRVKFYNETAVAAPTQGQAFFYFGDDVAAFAKRFRSVGFVVTACPGAADG